ncbi:hypothetical protein LZ575_06250 [Antarcticibacterium sp. 1MA-6-2]|uniref:SdrD B-like domain-containing protein n=1 Tax=Antarcticibacterium sp. 1MA-6-2 TaxID=2908210 RepID=UPI001F2A82B0|nr:SdrD B-like domain-containing protein [Antarcticibacterium sp. 1MA-6-2]UJH92175.1 hypothetical protein LZ575_06250 [Antarcticibacterium sp. 1MA-6-2]
MKQCISLVTAVLLLGFMFAGCEADESIQLIEADSGTSTAEEIFPTNKLQEDHLPAYFVAQLEKYETVMLNTYTVNFIGRTVTGTGNNVTTTFKYKVSGGGATPQLDSFTLEIPGCAGNLQNQSPNRAFNLYEDAIKWNKSVSKDGSQDYSMTMRGNIPLGVINVTATRGSISDTKEILGPCKGVFTLNGSIYIDANSDGFKQASESGIPSFLIDLFDENDKLIATVPTSANGSYSFMVLQGTYKIAVNGDLLNDENYTAAGNTFFTIENLQENGLNYNFGYLVNTSKIIQQLDDGKIRVNTEPTKFWVQQIRHAGKKGSLYSKEDIRNLLIEVEGMLLPEPFQFGNDKEAMALSILSRPIRTELDEFLQQLLTAELNIASDRGAFNPETNELNSGFNTALLIYSEAVACTDLEICPAETTSTSRRVEEIKALRSSDTKMLLSFNGSGGV